MEDALLPVPVFKETLYEDPVFTNEPVNMPQVQNRYGNLKTDDDNMFDSASRYSSIDIDLNVNQSESIKMPVSYSEMDRIMEEERELDEKFPRKEKKTLFSHVA